MTISVSVQGTDLDALIQGQGVGGVSGLYKVPAKRGGNIEIPGRDGALHVPAKLYGPATVVLPCWVRGTNPDGTVPSDTAARLTFHHRVRDLVALMCVGELVTVRHTLSDATSREITGEVTDVLDFTITDADRSTLGLVTVGLNCADPFWSDSTTTTADVTVAPGAFATLTGFQDSSARINDLVITFFPGSNPVLSQPKTGAFVSYSGIIDAGRRLVIDTTAWSVTGLIDAGGTWTPASAPTQHIARLAKGNHARLFTLTPERPAAPVIRLDNTGGVAMRVTVTGKQKYLVA